MRQFLEKYTKREIPSESGLRKNYLNLCYTQCVNNLREKFDNNHIWLSVDETVDVKGRSIVNVIVGALNCDISTPYLLHSEQADKVNHSTICQIVTKGLSTLWPNGIQFEKLLLFLTDAAPYMKKAGKSLKDLFPSMIHLTCLAHAFHNIAEHVREQFPEADKLISCGKSIFLKSPSRLRVLNNLKPLIPLPPKPVITRWGNMD